VNEIPKEAQPNPDPFATHMGHVFVGIFVAVFVLILLAMIATVLMRM
jgi:hypothetical protein